MKKILIGVFIMVVLFTGCKKIEEESPKTDNVEIRHLMTLDEYKDISVDNIESINKIRFTEGGRNDELIDDKTSIRNIYNRLKNIKIGAETEQACEDNTTVYEIKLQNNETYKVEIECDWVIINNKRYLIVK